MAQDKRSLNEDGRTVSASPAPRLAIDWDFYMNLLEESDAPDEQKRELIQTLLNIVVAFVDLGFGIHPLQQAQDKRACGQNVLDLVRDPSAMVDFLYDNPEKNKSNHAAHSFKDAAERKES
ncbi:hypothetical protein ACSSV1_004877 [Labrenzia sp. MBR-25]